MTTVKDILANDVAKCEYWSPGNSTCQGCGLSLALRWVMKALGPKTVLVAPASCLNVVVGVWPKTAPDFPFINMAFAGGAAAATGMKLGLNAQGKTDYTVMTFAGDGGTTDIGFQGLSGAAERNSDIIYVCYDNEAYSNTGEQRSSSTPYGAITTTTPYGKKEHKKYLPMIVAAHNIPYVATASVGDVLDLYDKFQKAKLIKGFRYIQIMSPCPPGWRYPAEDTVSQTKKAVETGVWPLFEIENGNLTLSKGSRALRDSTKRKPLKDYFGTQGRYKKIDEEIIQNLESDRDRIWRWIESLLLFQEQQALKKIIPCLDIKNGKVVKGIKFENIRDAGDPVEFAAYYQAQGADELVFLDITATVEKRKTVVDLVKKVAAKVTIPFCVGGGISTLEDVQAILEAGATKVSIASAGVKNPELLQQIAKKFGSKRLVCAIDAKRVYVNSPKDAPGKNVIKVDDKYCWFDVLTHGGSKSSGIDALDWALKVKELGVGEILPTSKDEDGVKKGYDLVLTREIAERTGLPVTASGGAGTLQHILEAFTIGKASAALAASIFHFREISIPECKEFCRKNGIDI